MREKKKDLSYVNDFTTPKNNEIYVAIERKKEKAPFSIKKHVLYILTEIRFGLLINTVYDQCTKCRVQYFIYM